MGEHRAVTLDGGETTIAEAELEELESRLAGELVRPDSREYDGVRSVWNGLVDRRPAAIARCATAEDVVEAIRFGTGNGLLLAVRGGGHGVAGNAVCDGGLVIDLSRLNRVEVDADRRLVRAEGGCRLADVDRETQRFGLATPLGVVSETGIAGLTLAGGMGWLRREHGLSCDNLVSAEVVTADGRRLKASEEEHADLFWGLRGGGGNFGVVTAFEYRLHPVGPEVMLAFVLYPGSRAREVVEFFDRFMSEAPERVSPLCFVGRVPAAEAFPAAAHGEPFVALAGVDPTGSDEALRPLRELGDPIVDLSGKMPYVEAQQVLDEDYPEGGLYYWKSIELEGLGDAVLELLLAHAEAAPSGASTVDVWYHGGATSRVPPGATAYGERPLILLGYEANFDDPAARDENVAWVRESIAELKPYSTGGTYLNFPGFFEEGEDLVRESYGENYARLAALKAEYDPTNVFRLNGNIKPSA